MHSIGSCGLAGPWVFSFQERCGDETPLWSKVAWGLSGNLSFAISPEPPPLDWQFALNTINLPEPTGVSGVLRCDWGVVLRGFA